MRLGSATAGQFPSRPRVVLDTRPCPATLLSASPARLQGIRKRGDEIMYSEIETAQRIRSLLNGATDALDAGLAARLRQGRERALARHRPQRVVEFAPWAMQRMLALRPGHHARDSVVIVMLLAAAIVFYYRNQDLKVDEYAEIDSALLADELPPSAYLDKGFFEWLARSGLTTDAPSAQPQQGREEAD